MNMRELLIAKLDELSEQDIADLVQRADDLQKKRREREFPKAVLAPHQNPNKDPLVGFLTGPTDAASRIEELLYGDEPNEG